MPGDIRIGISGWRYAPWRGVFYPDDLPQRSELAYASRQLATIEINGSFYSLQRPESYSAWHDDVPEGFVFTVKGGRYVTHLRRLKDVRRPLANFFASGVLRLGRKLGPFLWQLPPHLKFDSERLATFFELLPRTMRAAAKLASEHDTWMRGRVWFDVHDSTPLRHTLEVRHPSFVTPEFVALLREHQVALVVADTAGKWPFMEDLTADFVYVRLHGDEELYASGYGPEALETWRRKITAWSRGGEARGVRTFARTLPKRAAGRDVYVYFDNDVKVRAPFDAMSLAHRLGIAPPLNPPHRMRAPSRRNREPCGPRGGRKRRTPNVQSPQKVPNPDVPKSKQEPEGAGMKWRPEPSGSSRLAPAPWYLVRRMPLESGDLAFGILPTALVEVPKVHARTTVFARLKNHWSQLRHAPPGERFERRYQARRRNGARESMLRRVLLIGLGVALACIGIVLMFIPGPAILFFFVAGAIFAEESRWVAHVLDRLEIRLRSWWRTLHHWWLRRSTSGKGAVIVTALLVAAASAYLTTRMFA